MSRVANVFAFFILSFVSLFVSNNFADIIVIRLDNFTRIIIRADNISLFISHLSVALCTLRGIFVNELRIPNNVYHRYVVSTFTASIYIPMYASSYIAFPIYDCVQLRSTVQRD